MIPFWTEMPPSPAGCAMAWWAGGSLAGFLNAYYGLPDEAIVCLHPGAYTTMAAMRLVSALVQVGVLVERSALAVPTYTL